MSDNYEKFNEAEIITGAFVFLGVDLIAGGLDATVVGLFVGMPMQILANFAMEEWWFKPKGGEVSKFNLKKLGKYFGSALPLANFIMFLWSAFRHNHPKALGAAGEIAGAALGGAAGGPAGARIGAAVGQYAAQEK